MDQPPARSAPPDDLAQSTDRHLVPERVDQARSIPPDRNSRRPNPLESDGGKPLLATLNTYRRENTPQNTRDEAGEQPPPPAEYPQSDGPELPRDRQAVLHVVRMRMLSFDQVARMTYFTAYRTVARRRLRRLRDQGWIDVWQRPVTNGGAPRYAHPTRRALSWGAAVTAAATEGTVLAPIVLRMTPPTPRTPWKPASGVVPLFLAHTEEANDVLIAWLRRSGERVLWLSSWDCPFPGHVEWRAMPQPDYVLVVERTGEAHLVFGEHDRGTETPDVVATKFRTYRAWMETPDIARQIFGFSGFRVFVTVSGKRPERRLAKLVQVARDEGVARFTSFMIAGPDTVPTLTELPPTPMDFTHCRYCETRVPLDAETCPTCGAPTHELRREDLSAELSEPPTRYAAELNHPDLEKTS